MKELFRENNWIPTFTIIRHYLEFNNDRYNFRHENAMLIKFSSHVLFVKTR